jgi:hypothetical protein
VERRCSLEHHFKYQRTKDQSPDYSGEKVKFTPSLQIPEDQGPRLRLKWREVAVYIITSNTRGPRTRLKWRERAVYSITSNTCGPRTKARTKVESRCSLQHYFIYQRTKDQTVVKSYV